VSPVRERCRPTAPSDPLTSPSRARGCLAGEAGDGDERGGTGDQGGHGCVAGRRAAVEDGEGGEGGGGGGARGAAAGEGGAANRAQARHRHDAQLHGRAAGALDCLPSSSHVCPRLSVSDAMCSTGAGCRAASASEDGVLVREADTHAEKPGPVRTGAPSWSFTARAQISISPPPPLLLLSQHGIRSLLHHPHLGTCTPSPSPTRSSHPTTPTWPSRHLR
jgi:hypothetical protein